MIDDLAFNSFAFIPPSMLVLFLLGAPSCGVCRLATSNGAVKEHLYEDRLGLMENNKVWKI